MSGLVGIFFSIPILFTYVLISAVHVIISMVALAGAGGGGNQGALLTPGDIFFNRVALTNINFFNFTEGGTTGTTLRNIIAEWFVIFMGIAIIALLFVLVYLAIKILISSAQEKAKYKETLINWVVSVGILFSINIYAIIIIGLNNMFVSFIAKSVETSMNDPIELGINIFENVIFNLVPSLLIYGMFVRYTATFLFQYVKRMLKVAFLIIIAPLISVTYAVDKFADKKAQALSSWTKQFTAEVLIQPFHALIYLVLLKMSLALNAEGGLFKGLISIIILRFIFEAEKIIKKIFAIRPDASMSDGDKITNAVLGSQAVKKIKSKVSQIKPFDNTTKASAFGKFREGEQLIGTKNDDIDVRDKEKVPEEKEEENKNVEENNNIDVIEPPITNNKENLNIPKEKILETSRTNNKDNTSKEGQKKDNDKKEIPLPEKESFMKKMKDTRQNTNKQIAFGFALAGGALEVGDAKDSVIKNLTQGAIGGYAVGQGAQILIENAYKKHELKKIQKDNYSNNINITTKELAKNASIQMALNGISLSENEDEASKMLLDWMNKIEKADTGSLAATFEANKAKLSKIYMDRDGLNEIQASEKVEELQEEVIALGDNINVNEYDKTEKDFINSMVLFKSKLEKEEIESLTSQVDKNPYEVVKANLLEKYNEDKNIIDADEIKENSAISTYNKDDKVLEKGYEDQVRSKNKKLNNEYTEFKENLEEYNTKFGKTKEEIQEDFDKSGKQFKDYKIEHDMLLQKVKGLEENIKTIYKEDYELDTDMFKIGDINSKNAVDFMINGKEEKNTEKEEKNSEENNNILDDPNKENNK